jgi:hypothetical protein
MRQSSWKNLHIVLGPVTYELPKDRFDTIAHSLASIYPQYEKQLGKLYNLAIALKFNIGELDVTWNRESLQFNDKTIEAIKAKFISLIEEAHSFIPVITKDNMKDIIINNLDEL